MDERLIQVKIEALLDQFQQSMDRVAASTEKNTNRMAQQIDKDCRAMDNSMQKMASQVTGAVKDMHSQVSSSLTKIGQVAIGVGAILAGGKIFKGVVDEYVKLNSESKKLSVIMGLTIADAGAMIQTFKRFGLDTETVTSSLIMMTRQLKTNEQGFTDMGIKTRDASGNLLPMNEILFNSITRLKDFKEGTDRLEAAMVPFGRQVGNMPGLLKMTAGAVEETKRRMQELGIELGEESAAKARKYKEGLHDVSLVFDSIKYKVGSEVIPVLIQLAKIFGEVSIPAVKAMGEILSAFENFRLKIDPVIISPLIDRFSLAWEKIKIGAEGAAKFVKAELKGNIIEAATVVIDSYKAMERASQQWAEKAVSNANEIRFAIMNALAAGQKAPMAFMGGEGAQGKPVKGGLTTPPPGTSGGESFNPPPSGGGKGGGGSSLLQQWKEELDTLKTEENAFLDFSKEREKEFWQDKLEQCKEGSKEYLAVRRELFTLEKGMAKEAVTLQLAELDRQMTSEKTNWQQRLALENQKLAILASKYGQNSMQYAQELKKKQILLEAADKAERELQQQKLDNELKLQQMSLAAKEETVRFKQQMGLISGMAEARMLADLKKQELGLEQTYFEQSLELWQGYGKKIEEILGRRNEFYQKKTLELQKIDEKQALAGKQRWENFLQPLNQALETSVQGIIMGTNKMGKALANSAQSILAAWVGMLGKKLTTWIATELGMLTSTEAGAAARAGVETAAAATSKGVKAAAGSAGIIASAAEAAAAAYKAVVGIYIIGPILAPIAAATAFAGVMAYKAMIPSAAGGWDVSEDTLAYVHKDEKILPAGIAKSLDRISLIVNRLNMPTPWPNWTVPPEAFDFGLSPQFSAVLARREDSQSQQIHKTETHVHNNIQAWDSRDVGRFVRDQGAGMADGLARGAARNYSGRRLWRRW